jgi:selenocysteine lyase/cysteine desulfurase
MTNTLLDKSRFPRASEVAYLDTAAEGLPPVEAEQALLAYYRDKAGGTPGRRNMHVEERACVSALAGLLDASTDDIALLSCAGEGLNVLANALTWAPGDEVLISDLEFPSDVLAWLRLRDRGVRLRVISSQDGAARLESYVNALGPSTRVVCVSQVSYKTGANCTFLPALAEEAHRAGAILCVDATQALGRVPVPLAGIDYLVASSYKWLLGTHGLGVVYLPAQLRNGLRPGTLGWYSVQDIFTSERFERYEPKPGAARLATGMPNFPAVYALRRGVELLSETGIEAIHNALEPLVVRVRDGFDRLGLDVLTPSGAEWRSGIVSFRHPEAKRIGAALEQAGVVVWAGDGRVRASVHLYNDKTDVRRLLASLEEILCTNR